MPDNIDQLRAELREEVLREQALEAEQRKINANTFSKVLSEFSDDFKRFDWSETYNFIRPWNGTAGSTTSNYNEAYKVRAAIGALAKAAFRVKAPGKIPVCKEAQLRKITMNLLDIVMNELTEEDNSA